jgi:REP element-mobilizing transposase RayT
LPDKHDRHSIRLKEYDYALPGAYFVTICTRDRACLFGHVMNGEMHLNEAGEIVRKQWFNTTAIRPYVRLNENEFVVMPNHMHAIVWIVDIGVGATGRSPLRLPSCATSPNGPKHASIGAIMAGFKSVTAKRINQVRGAPGAPVWQRNYYEHVARNEQELMAIREYIQANPARWDDDENNPAFVQGDYQG